VKICITAILIAGFENKESGINEVNIGGRLMDPKIVIASRNKNVAATTLGNLVACTEGGCDSKGEVPFPMGVSIDCFGVVGPP
jgi:hypothetical protein